MTSPHCEHCGDAWHPGKPCRPGAPQLLEPAPFSIVAKRSGLHHYDANGLIAVVGTCCCSDCAKLRGKESQRMLDEDEDERTGKNVCDGTVML